MEDSDILSLRKFSLLMTAALTARAAEVQEQLKVLAVVAHPDDEYQFAAVAYRVARELGGIVDQLRWTVVSRHPAGFQTV